MENNNDIQELIGNFSAMLQELKEKQDKIEGMLNDVMEGANNAYEDWDHNKKKSEFTERNKDFLDKYSDKLKKIEGDDFDLAEEVMKGVGENDEAQYITALAASIDEQLDALREALGASEVRAEDSESNEEEAEKTSIEADGKEVAEVFESKTEGEDTSDEKKDEADEKPEDASEKPEAEDEDSEEELEVFRKQIADEKAAMGR